MSRPPAQT